jgi:pantetheine-phosphate adenylyltransferase
MANENNMKKIGLYPTSADPITNGHIEIIHRSLNLFDEIIIGIGVHNKKIPLFSLEEREELIRQSIVHYERVGFFSEEETERIKICSFKNLVVEFAEEIKADFIIRGIRNVTDYEYEYQFFHVNTRIEPTIEHIYFMSGEEDHFISSSIVKELWSFGNDNYRTMVPEPVYNALKIKKIRELM